MKEFTGRMDGKNPVLCYFYYNRLFPGVRVWCRWKRYDIMIIFLGCGKLLEADKWPSEGGIMYNIVAFLIAIFPGRK